MCLSSQVDVYVPSFMCMVLYVSAYAGYVLDVRKFGGVCRMKKNLGILGSLGIVDFCLMCASIVASAFLHVYLHNVLDVLLSCV